MLRALLVAALLSLAAGVLYLGTADPGCADRPAGRPSPTSRATPGSASGQVPRPARDGAAPPAGRAVASDERPDQQPLPAGTVGVAIRLAEPAALAVIRPGARVDLLAVSAGTARAGSGQPVLLAGRALVLGVTDPAGTDGTAALYLALPPDTARRAISMPQDTRFAVLVRS